MSEEDILSRIDTKWGKHLDVGEGWYELVFKLDRDLADLDPNYTIAQVKEKFGGLRFYLDTLSPESITFARALIQEAEVRSMVMCEVCGEPATLRSQNYYIRTVCDFHA